VAVACVGTLIDFVLEASFMRMRRYCAALLVSAFILSGCQGGATTHLTPTTLPARKHERKPRTVVSSQCFPPSGQSVGTITEYSVAGTNPEPFGIVADQSGSIWFTEWNAAKIAKYNIAGGTFSTYTTPTGSSEPIRITIGPDGNPWATEVAIGKVAKLNLGTGTISEYGVYGGASSLPEWIDTVPAGNANSGMWISVNAESKLEQVSTAGSGTAYTSQSGPYGISADSLGNVWYATLSGNKIGVRRTDGSTGSWTIPTSGSQPYGITEGPPGTGMWFAEAAGNKIGNITSSGTITEYTIPTAASHPTGIVSACGNLWFTEYDANKIGEFNPITDAFTEYSVPTASSEPVSVAVDTNGNVWFTERAGNKIGMIATSSGTDPNGAIYIFNSSPIGSTSGQISIYAAGTYTAPTSTLINYPGASGDQYGRMTFDADGDLWMAYSAVGPSFSGIAEYAPGSSGSATPLNVITPLAGGSQYEGIAVDSSGNSYVYDVGAAAIYVFASTASGSSSPIRTISGSSTLLGGGGKLSFDSSGNLWAATNNGMLEFSSTANGNVAPVNDIAAAASLTTCGFGTEFSVATPSFAFDSAGNMIVAFNVGVIGEPNVLKYAAGSTSTSCPTSNGAVITPSDISLDDHGYMYVLYAGASTYIYKLSDVLGSFTASPVESISGSGDGMNDPVSIATWTNTGFIYGNGRHRKLHRKLQP
jgi:streptogramin lyase